jgi:hypothetical protein
MLEAAGLEAVKKAGEAALTRASEVNIQGELARQTAQQESFRVGELSRPELRDIGELREREATAAADIRSSLSTETYRFESARDTSIVNLPDSAQGHESISENLNQHVSDSELIKNADINQLLENKQESDNDFRENSPYSSEVSDHIRTKEEQDVYIDEGLRQENINDREVLTNPNIDWDQKDAMGRTNKKRAEHGLAPLDANGESINLHHIGQKSDSPLAELPNNVHKENDGILHDKTKPTEVHGENSNWDKERSEHWQERAKGLNDEH